MRPEEHAAQPRSDVLMDLDLDLDASWPFDQIFAEVGSNPASPTSERPCSPLWAFSDDNNNGNFVAAAGLRLSDSPGIVSYTSNPSVSIIERAFNSDDKRKQPTPFARLVPMDNPDGSCIIKERMMQALRYFKDLTEQHVLAQVWAPVKSGGRNVLTTSGQPFVLDPSSSGLHQYRMISLMYMFAVDGDVDANLGLIGRVFRQRVPEWTPDVQYYSSKEFLRLNHALHYNVRGTLALPVFEPKGQSCIGVLELIMTSQKINYAPEVDKVCKALEAVNLKSSEILDQCTQICNDGRRYALAEILVILTVVCETHTLPLAQTWVPCRHRSILANGGGYRKTCSSFDGSCIGQICMSMTDVAYYIVDAHLWSFREACAEHHLQRGQGVAGKAFASHGTSFCRNIMQFCKNDYPLVHYARMFGLRSCFAICLRSDHTGNDEYVLEFFLPSNLESYEEQRTLLDSVLATMKKHFGSLSVASGKDLDDEWRSIEILDALSPEFTPNEENLQFDGFIQRATVVAAKDTSCLTEARNGPDIVAAKDNGKKPERKRGKAEKTISLEVLQQYFAGSLKDAAKSLGVCPTTMKRICRQHGISRWPSRKINKVNRSLSKLKRVIESVQGGEGTFDLSSLATTSIPVSVGSYSWAANMEGMNAVPNQIPRTGSENLTPHETGFLPAEGSNQSRTGTGSRGESAGTPTSQGSSHGSPSVRNEPSPPEQTGVVDLLTAPAKPFRAMLLEDEGSSHDLKNLCPGEPLFDEHATPVEPKTITVKATYREDIIRFRLAMDSGIVKLKEEVGKRLKLEVWTFEIKYLNDDHEWVLIACDSDLLECIDLSVSSGSNVVRLLIHDNVANPGSSCESSDE